MWAPGLDEWSNLVELELGPTEPLFRSVTFDATEGETTYATYKPEGSYHASGPVPVIIFLHGWGARGALPEELPMHDGMFREIAMGVPAFADFPFGVIAPICDPAIHSNCWGWANTDLVDETLDDAIARFSIDPRRIYVTGLSTGGQGTLEYAAAHPGRVAAAVPIASTYAAGLESRLCQMAAVPTWMFHSSLDTLQPPTNSQSYQDALAACPGMSQLDQGMWMGGSNDHAGWVEVYGDDHAFTNAGHASIYAWMLSFELP